MARPQSFFKKIVVLVFILLIPVIIIYTYSYRISVNVVESEIEDSSMRQLNFFLSQVENNAAQLALHSVTLSNERGLRDLIRMNENDSFAESLLAKKQIEEKLYLYSTSSPWKNHISVSAPPYGVSLSTYPVIEYRMPELEENMITRWTYSGGDGADKDAETNGRFTWYTMDPPAARSAPASADLIVEVSFTTENLMTMLDQFMTSRQGNPFFYAPGHSPIANRKGDRAAINELAALLEEKPLGSAPMHERMTISGEAYLVSTVPSATLGWYLVDFIPIEKALQPIEKNRNFFYIAISILLITGIALSFAIYRNVQIPIRDLMLNVQRLKRGDYSARLVEMPKNEFMFLFGRFNEMAAQIQELIEKVYAEKIRSHEATVKQLQSQINPHFFYNCLFFIVSMSRLGENKAVEAMATNLGDYFRYTTRVENQVSTLGQEIGLVRNYLTIQQLRQHIEYEVRIPEELLELPMPRLLIQPLVENAIVHGLEPMEGKGRILIEGERIGDRISISVEDSGVGMTERELSELARRCLGPLSEEMGCGLWNVHQRMLHIFGRDAGLSLSRSELGGVKAVLAWREEGNRHV